jgi:hypothetical protein
VTNLTLVGITKIYNISELSWLSGSLEDFIMTPSTFTHFCDAFGEGMALH